MSEQPVFFDAEGLKLQGIFSRAVSSSMGAVICHPHPSYGGTMDNNVVMAVAQALQDMGHSTLRFNFRGVGLSEGRYADGVGEADDVRAAIEFVLENTGDKQSSVLLAGYSFGAWVSVNTLEGNTSVSRLVLVAPPTAMFDFSMLARDTGQRARHFVVGKRDQFCDRDELQEIFDKLPEPKAMHVVPGADHFFFGREKAIVEAVKEAVSDNT
jgi:alpha/beta superfamily hydrolase